MRHALLLFALCVPSTALAGKLFKRDKAADSVAIEAPAVEPADGSLWDYIEEIEGSVPADEAVAPSGVHLDAGDDEAPLEGDFYQPDIIVVLTDGANTHGPLPIDAAHKAADRQVRVQPHFMFPRAWITLGFFFFDFFTCSSTTNLQNKTLDFDD